MSGLMFVVLAAVMAGSYIALRRAWLPERLAGIVAVAGCAVAMMAYLASQQGADFGRALLVGLPLGAILGAAIWIIARYYNKQERIRNGQP